MKVKFSTMVIILNIAICGAVATACYVTKSGWPLLGLIFIKTSITFSSEDKE